jgi:hypothetical protein
VEEPAVREVEMHLLGQAPLGANAEAEADRQYVDPQLRINRGPACSPVVAA